MSTMKLSISTSRPYRWSRWCHDVVGLAAAYQRTCEWRSRARSHHELMNLSDRILRDIGVSRRDVVF